MKVALVQLDAAWEDEATNLGRLKQFARQAREGGCTLACFPEMCTTGFSMSTERLSSARVAAHRLSEIAKDAGVSMLAGYAALTADASPQNVACCFDATGVLQAEYAKMRLFPLAGEDAHFFPGHSPVVFDIDDVPVSTFICYDLRFAELFRLVADRVAIMFVLANWPAVRKAHWDTLLRARAIENQCFVVGVNRTGVDGNGIEYDGGSLVIAPTGDIVTQATDQAYVEVSIDPWEVDRVRRAWPFLPGAAAPGVSRRLLQGDFGTPARPKPGHSGRNRETPP